METPNEPPPDRPTDAQGMRAELLDRVRRGDFSREEAETEADRLGVGPLATRPDASAFDPRGKPWWTLAMALAWIVWRTLDKVLEFDGDYRAECLGWRPFNGFVPVDDGQSAKRVQGYELAPLGPVTALMFDISHDLSLNGAVAGMTPGSATKELRRALSRGDLGAVGVPGGGGPPVAVAAGEWAFLVIHRDTSRAERYWTRSGGRAPAYTDMEFPSAAVLQLWPALADPAAAPAPVGARELAKARGKPKLEQALRWLDEHPVRHLGVKQMAHGADVSTRTMERAMHKNAGRDA